MNILFLDNCMLIKYEKVMTKQVSTMHPDCRSGVAVADGSAMLPVCSSRSAAVHGFGAILDVAHKSHVNMYMRVTSHRAVQQRAPLKRRDESTIQSSANMVL